MQKGMLRVTVIAALCAGLTTARFDVHAQEPAPSSNLKSSISPRDLLNSAVDVNSLETDKIGPWHLKATFTLFDALGNPTDHGTYDEFWFSTRQSKSIIESAGFSQASIRKGEQFLIVSGSRGEWPNLITKMRIGFIHSVYEEKNDYRFVDQDSGTRDLSLQCVSAEFKNEPSYLNEFNATLHNSSLCFKAGNPVLLTRADAFGIKTVRSNIFSYHGRYIARDLTVVRRERVYLKAHLESLEELNPVDKAQFNLPKGVYKSPDILQRFVPTKVAKQIQIRDVDPEYPAAASSSRISGVVTVETTIDVDGHVSDATAIDGPLLLQEPAVKAVMQYQFKPVTVFNIKCEVITVFPVEFKLPLEKQ